MALFVKQLEENKLYLEDVIYIVSNLTFYVVKEYIEKEQMLVFNDYDGNELHIDLSKKQTVFSLFLTIKDTIYDLGKKQGEKEKTKKLIELLENL